VLKGGSFLDGRRFARCARRHVYHPGARDGNIGFRVAIKIENRK
jgi:formylglycine-generating enzyme required for sulfatase activity